MLSRLVGIAATCALGATALIIPPGIAPASNSETSDLFVSVVNPKNQVITLPCSECAFPIKQEHVEENVEDGFLWIQGGANSLVLNFTVSEDDARLLLNGESIYPSLFQQGSLFDRKPIHVKQVPAQADLADIAAGRVRSADLEVTAYGFRESGKQALSPNGDMLVPIKFTIMGIENEYMKLDDVEIKLLETGDGELLIMEVESVVKHDSSIMDGFFHAPPFSGSEGPSKDMKHAGPPSPNGPPHRVKECNMLPGPLCKLKNMLEAKIGSAHAGLRKAGCRGRKGPHGNHLPTHIKPHLTRPGQDGHPKQHHGRPHHMRPHGQHHGHHHHRPSGHQFLRAFGRGLLTVLIPTLAGIFVGMSVSIVGLIVGRLIGFLWIKLVRGGRRGNASAAQQETLVEEGEDKSMIAEMEAPPVYEDAPAYVEVEKEEK